MRDWYKYFKDLQIDNFPVFAYYYYVFREPTIGYVRKHVPAGGSIIEFGCGTGLLGILFSSMGYEVLGVESNPDVAKFARENNQRLGGKLRIEEMDIRDAPRNLSKKFDLATSEGVIEHYQGIELDEIVQVHKQFGLKQMFIVPSQDDPLVTDQDTYSFKSLEEVCKRNHLAPIDRFVMGAGQMKWPKLLLPPILLKHCRWLPWENIGLVCKST